MKQRKRSKPRTRVSPKEKTEALVERIESVPPGAQIEDLRPDRKDPMRWHVVIEGTDVCAIDQRWLSEIGLRVGLEWDASIGERVCAAALFDSARSFTIASLTKWPVSETELRRKLKMRGYDGATCDEVVFDMQRIGLLDDAALAKSLARSAVRGAPAGKRLIENKLRKRGLDRESVDAAIDEVRDGLNEPEAAFALACKRLRAMPASLDAQARRRRVYGALARRGFEAEVCAEAVNRALREVGVRDPEGGEEVA